MVFRPHIRMTMIGFIGQAPGADIWQSSLSLGIDGGNDQTPEMFGVFDLAPNNAVWDDMRDDVVAWFLRPQTRIRSMTRLQRVKFAYINPDGHYAAPVVERDCGSIQAGEGLAPIHPFQCALAVTLKTEGDLGRVKGRFFQPTPAVDIDPNSGLIPDGQRNEVRDSGKTLVENLGNQPGLDALDIRVIVASQGRHNADGSVRLTPRNWPVTELGVGRAVDTIRSRRSALNDSKTYVATDQV